MARVTEWSVKAYRALLFLYPADFRRAFQFELTDDVARATEEQWQAGGWRALLPLWRALLGDLLVTVIAQRSRAGWPIAAGLAVTTTLAALATSARVYQLAWARADVRGDDELTMLLLAVAVVLLVIVCTLLATHWIVRPLLARGR